MADLKDLASRYGVLKDKLNAQDFGPNDSIIASSLMHPQEAAGRASDWLQEKMRIAAGIPNQALEDEGSWYQTGIVPSMNEQAQAGLDLAGLMQTGAMPFAPASAGGTLGTFIGKNARNWDAQAAKLAEEKLNAGADPAEVWREHLIGRMPDKTLFSEIGDSKFRLSNSNDYNAMIADKRKAMAENIAQQKEFESLKNAESPQLDLYPKEFKKAINEKINNLRNDRNYIRDELSGDLGLEHGLGSFEGQRVRNAFQHSDLINAYPELTNDSIIKQNRMLGSGVRGQLIGTNIDLSNNLLDYPDEAASTALHEFQHAIQNHEGWGKGSNPLTSQSDYYNFLGKKFKDIDGSNILSKFNELSGKSEPYYRIKQIQDLQNISQPRQLFNSSDYYKYSSELRDLLGAPPKYGSKLPWAQDAGNIIANKIKDELTWNGKDLLESIGNDRDFAKKMIQSIEGKQNRIGYDKYADAYKTSQEMQRTDPRFKDLPNEEKMKLYQRSAGEAQARATQDRLDMDMAQRRENYPLAGGKLSDIPLEDLIYKYEGNGPSLDVEGYAQGGAVDKDSDYGYGDRPDKTKKGLGYFGELERPDGTGVMTEYSIGVPINDKEMDIPTLVPTLTAEEVQHILNIKDGEHIPHNIVSKAIEHAHKRIKEGKPVFATEKDLYANGGSVVGDLPFNDPDQLRLYHQAMQHYDDIMENTGASKKMGKTEARINYNTTTKGDRDRDKNLHTLIADYGVDVGKGANINATMIKPMEAEGVYLGNLTGSVPVGEGRASLGLQGLHTKYSDGLSGYTAGYNGKVGDGNLSASYFEPADHNSAGRQVQLEYSMPFADGGSVSEFEDPAHERLYRKAMAHFDDLVNA